MILSSQTCVAKSSATDGIALVRTNGTSEGGFELKTSTNGQPYFVLKASNGQVIGQSELYSSEASARNGIASVQKNCTTETVNDLTGA